MAHMIGSAVLDQSTVISSMAMLVALGLQIRLCAASLLQSETLRMLNPSVYSGRNGKLMALQQTQNSENQVCDCARVCVCVLRVSSPGAACRAGAST